MADDIISVPDGHRLYLRKRLACPLCQRPELRDEWDKIVWSRQFSIPHIMSKIKESLGIEFSPKEIKIHQSHIELVRENQKLEIKEKEDLVKSFIDRESRFLGIDEKRKKIKFDPTNQIDSRIKALSAQLVEMELNEWHNDPIYLQKIREWKSLMELKLKNEGTLVDKVEVSLPVQQVRDMYEKWSKLKEEKKNASRISPDKKNERTEICEK